MDVREPETQGQGNDSAALTPSQPLAFFPAPDLIATALEAGKIGVWSWDIATDRVTWSANLEDIHRSAGQLRRHVCGLRE